MTRRSDDLEDWRSGSTGGTTLLSPTWPRSQPPEEVGLKVAWFTQANPAQARGGRHLRRAALAEQHGHPDARAFVRAKRSATWSRRSSTRNRTISCWPTTTPGARLRAAAGPPLRDAPAACDSALTIAPDYARLPPADESVARASTASTRWSACATGRPGPRPPAPAPGLRRSAAWPERARPITPGAIDDYSHALEFGPGQLPFAARGLARPASGLAPNRPAAISTRPSAWTPPAASAQRAPWPGAGGPRRPSRRPLRGRGPLRLDALSAPGLQCRPHLRPGALPRPPKPKRKPMARRSKRRSSPTRTCCSPGQAGGRADPAAAAAFWQDQAEADPALRSLRRRLRSLQPAAASNCPVMVEIESTADAISLLTPLAIPSDAQASPFTISANSTGQSPTTAEPLPVGFRVARGSRMLLATVSGSDLARAVTLSRTHRFNRSSITTRTPRFSSSLFDSDAQPAPHQPAPVSLT